MHDDDMPLDADELMNLDERINTLSADDAVWVRCLFQECLRARIREAELTAELIEHQSMIQPGASPSAEALAQVALDTAEWLRTLWNVGYMGSGSFPAQPRSMFPDIELEDILKSSLFARIREGKPPLPFPPPTRHGLPWHDLIDKAEATPHHVQAEIIRDQAGNAVNALIEACPQWAVIEECTANRYVVQHAGKGPLFQLECTPTQAYLSRLPAAQTRRIFRQERSGILSFRMEWPEEGDNTRQVPLHATVWEQAEAEALRWIAAKHPQLYGQIRFERVE